MNPLRLLFVISILFICKPAFAAEEFKTAKGKLVITPINHATLVIEWGGKTIYVDPVGQVACAVLARDRSRGVARSCE